jgi:hypothetical protein
VNCRGGQYFCSDDADDSGAVEENELFAECLSDDDGRKHVCPGGKSICKCKGHGVVCRPDNTGQSCGICPISGARSCFPVKQDAVRCDKREAPFCQDPDAVYASGQCLVPGNPDTSCSKGKRVYVNGRWMCSTGEPQCVNGIYNTGDGKCYPKGYPCSLGSSYPCVTPKGYDHAICSDVLCRKVVDTTPGGGYDKTDDGPTDPVTGECLGNLYIFNGYENRCRNASSATTGFRSCCSKDDYFFGLSDCKEIEVALARKRKNSLCVELGERCTKKTGFIVKFCIEKSDIFCCFTSKLARIVHEQIRPKLTGFNQTRPFGSAEGPACRGFTPEEFQAIDLNKLDLSEWYQDIETRQQKEVEHQMQDKIKEQVR